MLSRMVCALFVTRSGLRFRQFLFQEWVSQCRPISRTTIGDGLGMGAPSYPEKRRWLFEFEISCRERLHSMSSRRWCGMNTNFISAPCRTCTYTTERPYTRARQKGLTAKLRSRQCCLKAEKQNKDQNIIKVKKEPKKRIPKQILHPNVQSHEQVTCPPTALVSLLAQRTPGTGRRRPRFPLIAGQPTSRHLPGCRRWRQ
jgi:hypothetical protein